jgi:1,4-dihydroxy-2-naphthoyl-CoA hydrolase
MTSDGERPQTPSRGGSPFGDHLAIEQVLQEDDRVVARINIEERHTNPTGMIHGGAIISLADNTATAMANHANDDGENSPFMVAIDLHVVLLANQRGGEMRAESRVVRRGRRVTVVRTVVTGNADRVLAEVTTTHIPS